MNYGRDQGLSEEPRKAVISLKTNRGTQGIFIAVLDELRAAYYEIYTERVGIPVEVFRQLNTEDPDQRRLREQAKAGIPMNISIAEPTR